MKNEAADAPSAIRLRCSAASAESGALRSEGGRIYAAISSLQELPNTRTGEMHYVYIIESKTSPGRHYVGLTMDVPRRVAEHNDGKSVHTAKF